MINPRVLLGVVSLLTRVNYVYIFLKDLATGAVIAHFLIPFKQNNLCANSSSLYRFILYSDFNLTLYNMHARVNRI